MKKRMLACAFCLLLFVTFAMENTIDAAAAAENDALLDESISIVDTEEEITGSWIDDGVYKQPEALDTTSKTIEITSAEELAWLSYKVMNGTTFADYKITLSKDVDLSGRYWQPIGGWDGTAVTTGRSFQGSFDGQGHIIRNMNIDRPDLPYNGLFGCVGGSSFSISNLRVLGATVIGGRYSSVLIGEVAYGCSDAIIVNCGVSGKVAASENAAGLYCGSLCVLTFMNCYSDCLIENEWSTASLGYASVYKNCWWNADLCTKGTIDTSREAVRSACYGITEESLSGTDYVSLLNEPLMEYGADWIADNNGYPTFSAASTRSWITNTNVVTEQGGVYYITSPQELAYIAEIVNTGNDLSGKTVKLMKDIDLSGKCWTPIAAEDFLFAGTFDGNHHVISGLYMGEGNIGYYGSGVAGLFGSVDGTIQNVELQNVDISAGGYTGAIAGELTGTISGCRVSGEVSGGTEVGYALGGICGAAENYEDGAKIENCTFVGTVHGTDHAGGITGRLSGEIFRCAADGTVTGDYAGGIAGGGYGVVIKECFASGNVISSSGGNSGGAGGILASDNSGWYYECEISDCYTTCDVAAGRSAGGIAAYIGGIIKDCYSTGNISGGVYAGMMFGGNASGATVENCYWNAEAVMELDGLPATAVGMNDPDRTIVLSLSQLKKKESFSGFDFNNVWAIDADINGGMPYLQWQDVPVTVLPTKITLSESNITIGAGEAHWLTVVLSPANSAGDISWSSNAPSVASVSQEGCILGLSAGTATITATSGSVSATCRVTVEARTENAYQLGEITVIDERGKLLQEIPKETCWAQIELTKETDDRDAVVVLATYDKNGRYLGMYCVKCDIPVGSSVTFSVLINNDEGEISMIKAFVWSSITNPIPLCESASF